MNKYDKLPSDLSKVSTRKLRKTAAVVHKFALHTTGHVRAKFALRSADLENELVRRVLGGPDRS